VQANFGGCEGFLSEFSQICPNSLCAFACKISPTKIMKTFFLICWAPFFKIRQRWAPFCPEPDFRQIKTFRGALAPSPPIPLRASTSRFVQLILLDFPLYYPIQTKVQIFSHFLKTTTCFNVCRRLRTLRQMMKAEKLRTSLMKFCWQVTFVCWSFMKCCTMDETISNTAACADGSGLYFYTFWISASFNAFQCAPCWECRCQCLERGV